MVKASMIVTYTVDGTEYGLSALTPLVTADEATAVEAEQEMAKAHMLGVLQLVTSHLKTYGRNGTDHPAFATATGAYGGGTDTLEKVLYRCGGFDLIKRRWRDVPLALMFCRQGRVNELGTWEVALRDTADGHNGMMAYLVAPDENTARNCMIGWCSEFQQRGDGLYERFGRTYTLVNESVQKPPAEKRKVHMKAAATPTRPATNQMSLFAVQEVS